MDYSTTNALGDITNVSEILNWESSTTAISWPSVVSPAASLPEIKTQESTAEIRPLEHEQEEYKSAAECLPISIALNWSRLALSRLSPPFFARLMKAAMRQPGWRGPGSKPLSAASLRQFLEFWVIVRQGAIEPEIALVPNGHLQVGWYRTARRHLDMEFIGNGMAYYGLFDGGAIQEGIETVEHLAAALQSRDSKPLLWRSE